MSRQNVNLYKDEFKPKKALCSFQHSLVALAILLVFLCFQYYLVNTSYKEINAQYQSISSTTNINDLEVRGSVRDRILAEVSAAKSSIESQIYFLENMIAKNTHLSSIIQDEEKNNVDSLYEVFTAIAEQSIESISVSSIAFYQKDNEVLIGGLSRDKDSVTDYLSKVMETKSFNKSAYGLLKIEKEELEPFYRFTMKKKNSESRDYLTSKELFQERGG